MKRCLSIEIYEKDIDFVSIYASSDSNVSWFGKNLGDIMEISLRFEPKINVDTLKIFYNVYGEIPNELRSALCFAIERTTLELKKIGVEIAEFNLFDLEVLGPVWIGLPKLKPTSKFEFVLKTEEHTTEEDVTKFLEKLEKELSEYPDKRKKIEQKLEKYQSLERILKVPV